MRNLNFKTYLERKNLDNYFGTKLDPINNIFVHYYELNYIVPKHTVP